MMGHGARQWGKIPRSWLWVTAIAVVAVAAIAGAAWIGGAVYLAWAGLNPAQATLSTLLQYAEVYGARPGESQRLLFSALSPVLAAAIVSLLALSAPNWHIHGRGRWGNWIDLVRLGLTSPTGLILGEAFGGFVRDGGESHVLVVAPTGAGKTTGIVIPNLLSWTGSVVTLDPKREAWAASAGWRAAHGQVFLWAPLAADGRSARFNPLDQISTDKVRRVADLMKLAAAVIPEPENDTRWIAQGAQRLFRALALWVIDTPGATATVGEVWRIVTTPDDLQAWCYREAISRKDLDPACVADLAAFSGAVDKERAYILNELQNALQPWSSALVRSATEASDFKLDDLRRRRMAIYLAMDPADMSAYGRLFRVFFELAADALMRVAPEEDRRHKVLLLIDEFATFGKLPLIETLMASVRGYGARVMIVCQALSQIDRIYGAAGRNALLGNATRQICMPNPDPITGAYVSQRAGDATIMARSRSRTFGSGRLQRSRSETQMARALLKPEEFERVGEKLAILFVTGAPPFRVRVRGWFETGRLGARTLAAPVVATIATSGAHAPFRVRTAERAKPRAHRDLFDDCPAGSIASQVLSDVKGESDNG
jgi:type IV secretion system protein VirD4